jgi:hypothetical protein
MVLTEAGEDRHGQPQSTDDRHRRGVACLLPARADGGGHEAGGLLRVLARLAGGAKGSKRAPPAGRIAARDDEPPDALRRACWLLQRLGEPTEEAAAEREAPLLAPERPSSE